MCSPRHSCAANVFINDQKGGHCHSRDAAAAVCHSCKGLLLNHTVSSLMEQWVTLRYFTWSHALTGDWVTCKGCREPVHLPSCFAAGSSLLTCCGGLFTGGGRYAYRHSGCLG